MGAAIEVRDLRKRYGGMEVLHGVDFDVARGELLAVLGPNGAGKTTTIEILEGLNERDSGEVRVLGDDPSHPGRGFRERVGVVLQQSVPEPFVSVRELLALHASFYPRPLAIDELLGLIGLEAEADRRVRRLSGGQQRRLDLGLALVGDPELVFLDEPTTGFDPAARHRAWDAIRGLRALGKTIVLTTHYLEEAEALADRVVVLAGGRIVADGSPASLAAGHGAPSSISFVPVEGLDAAAMPVAIEAERGRWIVRSIEPTITLHRLTGWALEAGVDLVDLSLTPPRLEDVYLELTR